MVAQTSIPDPLQAFRPDPERVAQFIDALASPDTSLEQIATAWNTTVGALCLFIESEAGFELLGGIESALSTRLRITALSALPAVVTTLIAIVNDCPTTDDATAAHADLPRLKLIEFKRNNARRAAALLIRIGNHRPRTTRRAAIVSAQPSHPASTQSCEPHVPAVVAQTCGTPKRPLGRGEASVAASGASAVRASSTPTTSDSASSVVVHVGAANTPRVHPLASDTSAIGPVDLSRAQTCGTPKRPLGRGEVPVAASVASPLLSTRPSRASSLATRAGSSLPSGP